MTGVISSGWKLAAVPVSSATRIGARRLITTPSTGTRPSSSIVSSLDSTLDSRAVSASICALNLGPAKLQHAAKLGRADLLVEYRPHLLEAKAKVLQCDDAVQVR